MNIKTNHKRIRIKMNLAVPPEKAWKLLTEENHIANWWGKHVHLESKPGGIFREVWFDGGTEVITSGKVTVFRPPCELAMTWADDDWPGETIVHFTLEKQNNRTTLLFEHTGWEIHPKQQLKGMIKAHTDGWAHYLNRLEEYAMEMVFMNHIKVYKTDIDNRETAQTILQNIQQMFREYETNFDLEDCDNVLRVENQNGPVDESALKNIFKSYGYSIKPLT